MAIARRYTPLNITTPAGTLPTAPQRNTWNVGDVWLYEIDLKIPPGHGGQTGIRFELAGSVIVPWGIGTLWVNGDDDYFPFDVEEEIGNGLTVVTYNTDIWNHSFYIRFVNKPISATALPPPIVPVPVA